MLNINVNYTHADNLNIRYYLNAEVLEEWLLNDHCESLKSYKYC